MYVFVCGYNSIFIFIYLEVFPVTLCISSPLSCPLWGETPVMTWTEWAPGPPRWLAAWPQGLGCTTVHHPSGSRRGQRDPGGGAGRSSGRTPAEMRPRRRRRRRKRRRSRSGSPLPQPASWPPPLASAPPVWPWCHWGRNLVRPGWPGGHCYFLYASVLASAAQCWESLAAALFHQSAWYTNGILIRITSSCLLLQFILYLARKIPVSRTKSPIYISNIAAHKTEMRALKNHNK